ncbi:MAG TPA: methenyltetrahydromethanopterin cyclohydrolase [Pirellulales bacterium]|jgi:methenyltetrahydromethanopterin cyclohydrolase
MNLNQRAASLCQRLIADAERLRVNVSHVGEATVIDAGIQSRGGLEAGLAVADVCMAGLGRIGIEPTSSVWPGPAISVATDHPIAACMASQYAGWQIAEGNFFAMGSGPMRAAAGKEELFARLGHRETTLDAVGVLETRKMPSPEVIAYLAAACQVSPDRLTLLVAPTASQAGGLQIVARSIETALHKLHEIGFDLTRIESGFGVAPLPPVAVDDLAAIGRTNDSILYGAEVTLWVRGSDEDLIAIGPRIPSNSSEDHGQPFRAIFERYERDFYRVDRHLFSPAVVTLINLDSGRTHRFGTLLPEVIQQSFTT